ncbi:hypothetical protein Tco_0651767 [Tanacetum coccineum]|uniref:Uncharacterized protein n=1 Tax=Tanacetum coccineum TaxID=301880 RepID=A0ABQ4WVQ6_9ASTR
MMVQAQEEMGEGLANPTDPHHTPTIIQPLTSQPQKKQKHRNPKRKDTEVPQLSGPTDNVADEAVYEEMDDSLERATTTATSLDAEQDRGNINKTQSKATLNEPSSIGTSVQVGLLRRVESFDEEGLGEEDASKQGRISDIDDDAGITLVSTYFDADTDMFGVHDLDGDEVVVESEARASEKRNVDEVVTVIDTASTIPVSVAITITAVRIRPRVKGLVIHEQEQAPTLTVSSQNHHRLDEELAFKLQAEEEEEERLAREKAQQVEEANIAWDDVQAKIEADYQLAKRLQDEEQEQFTDAKKARLFVQFLEQRRKHFAAKRAEEKRSRPLRRAQQRSIMCTYLKNMEGWKPKDLKNKSFANIQGLFDKAMKRVNTFVNYRTELVEESSKKAKVEIAQESSSKRAGDELKQKNAKKQKVDEDKETAELQSLIEVAPDEKEVAIDVVPLATKPPTIVDWKIHKEGKKSYYQIIRVDGSSKRYLVFNHMLKSFDMKDLETLYKLVKAKYGSTRPVEDLDLVLYGDLKAMF